MRASSTSTASRFDRRSPVGSGGHCSAALAIVAIHLPAAARVVVTRPVFVSRARERVPVVDQPPSTVCPPPLLLSDELDAAPPRINSTTKPPPIHHQRWEDPEPPAFFAVGVDWFGGGVR